MSSESGGAKTELVPELCEYERQLEGVLEEARDLVGDLDDIQLNWRPQPGSWSIAECLKHLNVVAGWYLGRIDKTVARAREEGLMSFGPYRHGRLANWFIAFIEPPPKLRLTAPRLFVPPPPSSRPTVDVVPEFMDLHGRLLEWIPRANGIDLGRARTTSPAGKLLKLSLGQCFRLVACHARRHLWQARNIRNASGFPQ